MKSPILLTFFALLLIMSMVSAGSPTVNHVSAQFTETAVEESFRAAQTATAVALLPPKIQANADWTPVERDFNGVTMVQVPAGCFEMGMDADEIAELKAAEGDADWIDAMAVAGSVCIEQSFWLDKTEVTQAQFVAQGGVKANTNAFTGDNRPIEHITWFEARDYCEQRGGRLPTEAEWEFAARGPDGLVYPWGDDFIADNVVNGENSNSQTADVGSRPGGKSWVGALDMSGNVWEWTTSLYKDYPYDPTDGREDENNKTDARVLRGGSWYYYTDFLRASHRGLNSPDYYYSVIGFRCALS